MKLAVAGLPEDDIAALDGDWTEFTPAHRAAFALARKLSYEPSCITDADIAGLGKHFTDLQILEMILSVAGNNALNRWKDGVGVPQSNDLSGFLRKVEKPAAPNAALPTKTFLTPTAEKYKHVLSKVAPLPSDSETGESSRLAVCRLPLREQRMDVEKGLALCRKRTPRLPLAAESDARAILPKDRPAGPLPQWIRLLANFPKEGRTRILSFFAAEEKSDLSPLLKAQVSWIIARQDGVWYALGEARQRLRQLGCSDAQIDKLDGDWAEFTPTQRALFTVARKLAASPIVLTDDDVAQAVQRAGPRDVVQLISYTTSRASFDRITEAAGLQLEH
jgi:alkylhydroperoxidase family enzyme